MSLETDITQLSSDDKYATPTGDCDSDDNSVDSDDEASDYTFGGFDGDEVQGQ